MAYYFYDIVKRRFIELKDGMVLGRSEGDERFPADRLMSGRHCRIHFFDGQVQLEDLNSSNKTLLNGRAIEPGVRLPLKSGALIEMGNQRFEFTESSDATPEVPAAYRIAPARPQAPAAQPSSEFWRKLGSFFIVTRWDASTRATGIFVFLVIAFFTRAYWPDFNVPFLHDPKRLLALSLAITWSTALGFLFAQYLMASNVADGSRLKPISMLVCVFGAALSIFALQAVAGVPLKLDQNRLFSDCRKIASQESFEWCHTWIQRNKNDAFFTLDAGLQAEALKGLQEWIEKTKAEKAAEPPPEAPQETPTPEPVMTDVPKF